MIGKIGLNQSVNYRREINNTDTVKTQRKPESNIALSEEMRTLHAAKASMENTQDVDMDKVAAMKAMLERGEMTVNLDNLANSIINYYELAKK